MRSVVLAVLCGVVLAASPTRADGVSDDEWKELSAEFARLWAGDFEKQVEGMTLLMKAEDVRATKLVTQAIFKQQDDRRLFGAGCGALRRAKDAASIAFLASQAGAPTLIVPRRQQFCEMVGQLKNPQATAALLKLAAINNPGVRIPAIDGLGHTADASVVPTLAKCLDDDPWAVRYAATTALLRLRHKTCVPPLVARLEKETVQRLRSDIAQALQALTGADAVTHSQWKTWWEAHTNDAVLVGKGYSSYVEKRTAKLHGTEQATERRVEGSVELDKPTYYGISLESTRVVFVIDMSQSMLEPYKGKRPSEPKYTVTLSGKESDPLERRRVTLDWDKIHTAWDLVREQLIFTLNQLDERTQFDIIAYNSKIRPWKGSLQTANPTNLAAAIDMLRDIVPTEMTNIHGAIEKAYLGTGKDPFDLSQFNGGPDTLYFLSDGAPTVGKIVLRREVSVEAWGWDKEMLAVIEDWNSVRKLQIHAVGIGGAAEHFMRALSRATHGTYAAPGYGD